MASCSKCHLSLERDILNICLIWFINLYKYSRWLENRGNTADLFRFDLKKEHLWVWDNKLHGGLMPSVANEYSTQ